MREQLQEIFATVSRNKLRTFLTGFSVAWGIFMLIILLGAGNGLKNAMLYAFSDESINVVSIRSGYTSMPYKGFQKWRYVRMNEDDMEILKDEFPEVIQEITASVSSRGIQLAFGREYMSASLEGVTPAFASIEGVKMLEGRFINVTDLSERRKVLVVDDLVVKTLFKGKSPVGKVVMVDKTGYMVVGVYKGREYSNSSRVYIPLRTMFLAYKGGKRDVDNIGLIVNGLENKEQITAFQDAVRARLAALHTFSPEDTRAIWMRNRMESYKQAMTIFNGIALFVWIIGIGTLIAGVVGVSNIMLVTVRERTFEFGIRKALGAKPSSLVMLILVESVLITGFFGYVGMIAGVGTMEVVNLFVERAAAAAPPGDFQMFRNPTLELSVTFSATMVLVIAGMVAGYVPARRAAQIKTIDAMRHNK